MSVIPRYYDGWEAMAAHPELDPEAWPCEHCGCPRSEHFAWRPDIGSPCPSPNGGDFEPHPDIDVHPEFEEGDA